MPSVLVNGVRLNYLQVEEPGSGPREDLIMVHGLATNMAFWYLPYAPVFARRFRVTLFDLRGLGRSEMTPAGYTPQNLALDLHALMDHLGIPRAHFVAHSFGGVVVLNLALVDPARVSSLVLCDSHISAVRRHVAGRDWGNRAHIQALVDRPPIDLRTPSCAPSTAHRSTSLPPAMGSATALRGVSDPQPSTPSARSCSSPTPPLNLIGRGVRHAP